MSEFKLKPIPTIRCEHPVILYNPYLLQIWQKYNAYVIKGRSPQLLPPMSSDYIYKFFNKTSLRIHTLLDVQDSYLLDTRTGEISPIYIIVPCGKCLLCNDRKISDWKCRAFCETSTSGNVPYHLTLTFNNENLPFEISKRELQLFLKRLRSELSYNGYTEKIKYAACGEYGAQKSRPHYHLILWNLPHLKSYELLHIFEKCWNKGFCYLVLCDAQRIQYVMKYINKKDNAPEGKCPPFFIASRKTAIGYEYLINNMQHFLQNPSLSFEVCDPFSGKIQRYGLPQYFIRKIYPTISTLIPKDIRDKYTIMATIHNSLIHTNNDFYYPHPAVLQVLDKFSFLPINTYDKYKSADLLFKDHDLMLKCAGELINYDFPIDDILKRKDIRKMMIDEYFTHHPFDTDMLQSEVEKIESFLLRQKNRELSADVPF